MFDIDCDEFSVTLPIDAEILANAPHYFENYVDRIDKKLELTKMLGNKEVKASGMNGYTHCFSFGFDKNQIKILYNPDYIKMKIMIRFTASALNNYILQRKIQFNEDISALNIIKKLSELDTIRLSRLDIAVDFVDENIEVNNLFNQYNDEKLVFFNKRNGRIKLESFIGGKEVETLYFNKRTNRSFLRVYNKKVEQEKNNGNMLKTALNCENWTRFELELKQEYAHEMTKIILSCNNQDEFIQALAHAFIDCIKIRKLKGIDGAKEIFENTTYYSKIIKVANGDEKLITTAARDRLSSFELKYKNLSNNGTLALFKMIKESYSEDDFERFIEMLKEDIDEFELSKEHKKLVQEEEKHSPFF